MIIPFRGKVQCTDKPGGHTNGVVVERVTGRVTHIIVREPGMLGTERVVPIENVVDSDADTVHLDMVLIQLNAMPAFKVSDEYRSISPQKTYGSAGQGASQQFMSSVEGMPANEQYLDMGASSMGRTRENIDENEVAVDQDVKVQATDGEI